VRDLEKRIRSGAQAGGLLRPAELVRSAESVDGTRFLAYAASFESMEKLKAYAKDVRGVLGDGVIALALEADEPRIFVTVSDDLTARGVSAAQLVSAGAPVMEGKGGGCPPGPRSERARGHPGGTCQVTGRRSGRPAGSHRRMSGPSVLARAVKEDLSAAPSVPMRAVGEALSSARKSTQGIGDSIAMASASVGSHTSTWRALSTTGLPTAALGPAAGRFQDLGVMQKRLTRVSASASQSVVKASEPPADLITSSPWTYDRLALPAATSTRATLTKAVRPPIGATPTDTTVASSFSSAG
jgi:hypothetical protein